MPQRSIPQRQLDDAAFPIRVKLCVPDAGLGSVLLDVLRWLRCEVGEANFAHHDGETLEREALAIHFRRIEDATAFLSAFPQLRLLDETTSRAYGARGRAPGAPMLRRSGRNGRRTPRRSD